MNVHVAGDQGIVLVAEPRQPFVDVTLPIFADGGDGGRDGALLPSTYLVLGEGGAEGVAGSDVAIEAADVVLMTDDFRDLAHAIRIGRRAVTNIQENIGASVLFNLLGITLAALGVLSPITAAAVHALPDVILFLNASRLFT
jgi:Cu+-exporting ATPase